MPPVSRQLATCSGRLGSEPSMGLLYAQEGLGGSWQVPPSGCAEFPPAPLNNGFGGESVWELKPPSPVLLASYWLGSSHHCSLPDTAPLPAPGTRWKAGGRGRSSSPGLGLHLAQEQLPSGPASGVGQPSRHLSSAFLVLPASWEKAFRLASLLSGGRQDGGWSCCSCCSLQLSLPSPFPLPLCVNVEGRDWGGGGGPLRATWSTHRRGSCSSPPGVSSRPPDCRQPPVLPLHEPRHRGSRCL